VIFVGDAAHPTAARLLFVPDAVRTVTNGAGDVVFEDGLDYAIDREAGTIVRPVGSRLPLLDAGGSPPVEPADFDRHLVAVTYTHAGDTWPGEVPTGDPARLPRTLARLRNRETVTVCLMGDSITEGYDASGFRHVAPRQAPWAMLVARGLEFAHDADVRLHNLGVAGWTADHGRWQAEEVGSKQPDLALIAFGMNDACYAEAPAYAEAVADIVQRVRAACPDTEFLLVSPMLPTPACHWVDVSRFDGYRDALLAMRRPGVAVADVTSVWESLLRRKTPLDLSSNGTNHPNDFGHRVYAQTLLAALSSDVLA